MMVTVAMVMMVTMLSVNAASSAWRGRSRGIVGLGVEPCRVRCATGYHVGRCVMTRTGAGRHTLLVADGRRRGSSRGPINLVNQGILFKRQRPDIVVSGFGRRRTTLWLS